MKTLPDRARRDARTLVTSPLALLIAVLFVAGGAIAVAAFPRDGAQGSPTASAQAPAALPAVTDDERAKIAQWWEVQPKVELPVPAGDAKVLIVKFNDYQCPACKLTLRELQADPSEVHRDRAGQVRRQAVPARAGVQPGRAERGALGLVRGGGVCPHGESEGHVR